MKLSLLLTCLLSSFSLAANKQPNILLIVGEDHGVELSCYGDTCIDTPHIDKLASEGILYKGGYVTQSVCSSSRSSIFTGLYPHTNGQIGLATHKYAYFKKWPTTYAILQKAGYRTGHIGKVHVNPSSVVTDFLDFKYQFGSNFAKRGVAKYAVKAGEFFKQESDKPFFLAVNYPDAHWPLQEAQVGGMPKKLADPKRIKALPYVAAKGETNPRMQQITQNYYNCMLRLDECVGQLLGQLEESGKADNTLVIFIGDHGAQMGRGKIFMYEGGTRVPYIARWPKQIKAGQRSNALVSTVDLLPTFLTAAGAADKIPANIQGKPLQASFTSDDNGTSFRPYLFCERNVDGCHYALPQRTIRDQRFKLIHTLVKRQDKGAKICINNEKKTFSGAFNPSELPETSKATRKGYDLWLNPTEYQLFDLKNDPHEWNNLADDPQYAAELKKLQTELMKWRKQTNDPLLDATLLEMLMKECDDTAALKKKTPAGGWKYLDYLNPDKK